MVVKKSLSAQSRPLLSFACSLDEKYVEDGAGSGTTLAESTGTKGSFCSDRNFAEAGKMNS